MATTVRTTTFEVVAQMDWQVGDLDLRTEDADGARWLATHRGQVSHAMWAPCLPVQEMGFSRWSVHVVAGELDRVTHLTSRTA